MRKVTLPYDGEVEMYDWKEGARIIRDAGRASKKYYKGMDDDRRCYCGTVGAFDIETSRVEDEHWKPGMPEMLHYFSYPYCWQFMIDGKFIFGQDPADFFQMLRRAHSTWGIVIIYIHNIVYEYNNLADFFLRNLKEVEIFWKNTSTPLYIRYRNFEFRCSALLTHKSLAMLGDEIGYQKLKGDLDYSIPRGFEEGAHLTPEELNYCYRDVAILERWVRNEAENYAGRMDPSRLPWTQTGFPREAMRSNFSRKPLGRDILAETTVNELTYRFLKHGFWGGYTHENIRYVGKLIPKPKHRDITSAYPWAMVKGGYPYALHPATPSAVVFLKQIYEPQLAIIARIGFYKLKLKKGGIPYCPWASGEGTKYKGEGVIEESQKVFYAAYYECTICDVDARLIFENYTCESFDCIEMRRGVKKPLPDPVIRTVLDFFEKKTTLKGVEGAEYEYGLSKQMLNGLYGICATSLIQPLYELDGLDTVEQTYQEDVWEDGLLLHRAGDIVYDYSPATVMPYQWCLYITAYVREAIYGMIGRLESKADFYYSDTDSIFYKDSPYNEQVFEEYNAQIRAELDALRDKFPNITPANPKGEVQYLGQMLLEDDDCEWFCTIGPKRYFIQHPDGTVDMTVSGLRGTKRVKDPVTGKKVNGRNVQRLIDKYGSAHEAFLAIKDGPEEVVLPYEEGTDKLSNYNVRYPFSGTLCGKHVERPCSFLLYPVPTTLSLNKSIRDMLSAAVNHDIRYEVVYNEIW